MSGGIGAFLKELRTSRQLSLNGLADRAALGKRTLSYWEAGTYQPRVPELQAVLDALGATETQREQALTLIGAPRSIQQLREEPSAARLSEEIGPMPSGGDLLRTMRQRRRLHLDQVAAAMRVSAGTLSRWEQGKMVPSAERLDALLTFLGAAPEERAALREDFLFLLPPLQEMATSVEELWDRFEAFQIHCFRDALNRLNDLTYLTFAAQAWRFAMRGAFGRRLLARIYSNYATYYLEAFHRYVESDWYANRALDLLPDKSAPEDFFVRAAITAAQAAVYRSAQPAPQRGLEMLRLWLPLSPEPAYQSWMLGNIAQYLALQGEFENAITLGTQAYRVAERSIIPDAPRRRKLALARIQMQAGNAEEALDLAPLTPRDSPIRRADIELLWAEGLLAMEDRTAAEEWLQRACDDIGKYDLTHLRRRADALAQRF
jgi:transcriptional regulator with XRE-family HTH domain